MCSTWLPSWSGGADELKDQHCVTLPPPGLSLAALNPVAVPLTDPSLELGAASSPRPLPRQAQPLLGVELLKMCVCFKI